MSTGGSAASWTLWPANSLAAIFDFAASSNRRALAVLAIVSLIAFVPGIFQIPPVDRDEARFAQATKQMIETGDYVDIRFQDEVRYKKPVGIYWLQAAVVKTAEAVGVPRARTRIWLYRMPSLAGAVGAVLATYWCALAFVGRRGAALAALMMLGSTMLGVEARLAKTDAMLLLTVVAAMGAMARVYLFPARCAAATAGVGTCCGVLDGAGGGNSAQGATDRHDRRPCRGGALDLRSFRALAFGVASASRNCLAPCSRVALVRRDLCPCRRRVPR